MDEISNKAIMIAVSIFITIAITSGVFFVINQIKTIYEQVYKTDISIQSRFSEFEAYQNTEKTGIEVLSTIKKYLDNPLVKVYIGTEQITANSTFYKTYKSKIGKDGYTTYLSNLGVDKYTSTVSYNEKNGITTIKFIKK